MATAALVSCSDQQETIPDRVRTVEGQLPGGPIQDDLDSYTDIVTLSGTVKLRGVMSFGDGFGNPSDSALTVTDVRFETVRGMTLLGVMRVPLVMNIGALRGFPPRDISKDWDQAAPLKGSVIKPGEEVLLVIGFRLDGKDGAAKRLIIEYQSDGQRYQAKDRDIFKLQVRI